MKYIYYDNTGLVKMITEERNPEHGELQEKVVEEMTEPGEGEVAVIRNGELKIEDTEENRIRKENLKKISEATTLNEIKDILTDFIK
jgi:hypothetical protein